MAAVLLGVAAALAWSVHDLFARSLADRVGPFRLSILVMIAGWVFLTVLVLARGTLLAAGWQGTAGALIFGLAYGAGCGSLFKAFSLGPVSVVGPITAAYPALVMLWSIVNGLIPTPLQWAAIAATMAGTTIVARSGHHDGGIRAVAPANVAPLLFYCAACSLAFAAAIVIGPATATATGEIETAWISRVSAVAALLPFLSREVSRPSASGRQWLGIAIMGALDSIGVVAINASGHLPNREFAAIGISAYGGMAVILAALYLKERVAPGQWFGIGLIVGGVATLAIYQ